MPFDDDDEDRPRREGDEPLTARSPLRLRQVLSVIALVAGIAAAVYFGIRGAQGGGPGAGPWVAAGISAAVAVIAAIDLWVIARRLHRPRR